MHRGRSVTIEIDAFLCQCTNNKILKHKITLTPVLHEETLNDQINAD